MAERLIEAAGGALCRPAVGGHGVEVVLVHRPKYDDWSLPKGKLTAGEHPVLGALREVWEETGITARPGRPLGEIRYLKEGAPKRVRFWAMQAVDGDFAPNSEVDQVMWLPPREGRRHLLPDRDQSVLTSLLADTAPTWPCIVVRHGNAGERGSWPGDDRERPLDDLGHEQAASLVPLLSAYGVERVLSADVLRCMETVGPYAQDRQLTVESEPLVSETGYAGAAGAAVERVLAILGSGVPSVVCSQGRTIPDLLTQVCKHLDHVPPPDTSVRKGGMWVLHLARDPQLRLAGIERFGPVA